MHYMVDLRSRLEEIKSLIHRGSYVVINRARQYGKTTTLQALCEYLKGEYNIISLDFQALSHTDFESEPAFISAFCSEVLMKSADFARIPEDVQEQLQAFVEKPVAMRFLFHCLSRFCAISEKPVILMIDEVDNASNNQVFLDFLAQLRQYYLNRRKQATFQSVILAGVYDIRNLKRKIRPDSEHQRNSPWNIAENFKVDMSFQTSEIAVMLEEYEKDHAAGMNVMEMAQRIYDYTSGYPFLVSRLCQIIDEDIMESEHDPDKSAAWTKEGFLEAVKMLLKEKNTLFDSLADKLYEYPELKKVLYSILFCGEEISYNTDERAIDIASMFGFLKEKEGKAVISNRIFETRLYNLFLSSEELRGEEICLKSQQDKNQFISNGTLDMERILARFAVHFNDLYGKGTERFVEEDGRKYFLLYLRPIINGVGNYYVEAQTRSRERTDIIVDYRGEQFIIEMKIWRGNAYHERGEEQLSGYLDQYHLKKGYMLSFCFNKKKEIGVRHIHMGDRLLVEAVV